MHLEIPEPCHENWNAMTPQEKGSFCDKCCKVVIDFTEMATEKVIEYINGRKNDHVCGRFRPDQIVVPATQKIKPSLPHRAKLFLAALVLVFGGMLFTAFTSTNGTMMSMNDFAVHKSIIDSPTVKTNVPPAKDTLKDVLMGKVEQTPKGEVKCVNTDTTAQHHKLMGKPMMNNTAMPK